MFTYPRRVGRLDAIFRFLVGFVLLAAAAYLLGTLQSDWKLSLIHVFIVGTYLVVTAVSGVDPIYNAFDVATNREWRESGRRYAPVHRPLP